VLLTYTSRARAFGTKGHRAERRDGGKGDDDDGWAKLSERGDALGEVLAFDQAK